MERVLFDSEFGAILDRAYPLMRIATELNDDKWKSALLTMLNHAEKLIAG